MVLGIKKDYYGVLHSSAGYYRVLGGTWVHWGHWLVLRVQDGSGGTVWYQRVLWRTIGYWGYLVILGGKWVYWEILGGTVGSWGVK